jgi:hypothetical protein
MVVPLPALATSGGWRQSGTVSCKVLPGRLKSRWPICHGVTRAMLACTTAGGYTGAG